MGVNPETKVGILTAFALLTLFSLFFWLNRVSFMQKGSEVDAVFERIDSLRPGAPVKYMGVDVGRIKSIFFEGRQIIIRIHINEGFEIPHTSKAYITSSGVVGDKFLDILPLKEGEKPLDSDRIRGQAPDSLEQLYSSATRIMEQVQVTVSSLNQILGDPSLVGSLKNSLANIEKLTASANGVLTNNSAHFTQLLRNAALASNQLAQACTTANGFLNDLDANGQTSTDLKELVANIKTVSANLETFSTVLAEKGPQLGVLTDDAHKTMGAINEAAQSVTQTLNSFGSTENGEIDLKKTLSQTAEAAQKVGAYVENFQKMSIVNQAGLSYRSTTEKAAANYQLDLGLDPEKALRFSLEDIGHDNLATAQYAMKKTNYNGRIGLYRNQFGVGLDLNAPANHTLGFDLWDTRTPSLGISSKWKFTPYWSMSFSASSKLEKTDTLWNVGWWRQF